MRASDSLLWVDSHCHLDFPVFDSDRSEVLDRAHAAGVTDFVVPGVEAATWGAVMALASDPKVHVALGLHPWWTAKHRVEHLKILEGHLVSGRVVAIGECGLDFSRDIDADMQLQWFKAQLQLATDYGLPVIVHAVRALDMVLHELAVFPGLAGVIHGFSGSRQQAERCIESGLLLGIGPMVTRFQKLREVVRVMPAEHLLLETDAPDRPLIGPRGEPAHVVEIGRVVAEIKRMEPEMLADVTSANARKLFRWGRA